MAIRAKQTILTNSCSARHTPLRRGIRIAWHSFPHAMALAITSLVLGSCADLGELRTDMAGIRSDLHTTTETLSQLSARVDELDRRQVAMDNTVRQTQQELTQAVEVLLKKALVTKNRLTVIESEKTRSKGTEQPDRQARQQHDETQHAASHGEDSSQARKHLTLDMTQEDVRRTLGDPISIEDAGSYIFWQYSQRSNQKYVVFDKVTRQLWGWRGL